MVTLNVKGLWQGCRAMRACRCAQLMLMTLLLGIGTPPARAAEAPGAFSFGFGASQDDKRAQEVAAQLKELDQRMYAYADRYTALVVSATDEIIRGNTDADQRRLAHQIKLVGTSSIYDIVTNADPFAKLMDLLLVVTLQSYVWIDEDRADTTFGARGEPLIRALRTARTDVWKLAAGVLKPDQLQRLDNLILESRKNNPDVSFVSFTRFNEVSAARNKSLIAELKVESGLFSSISEATKVADEVRLLGERAFYQSKRLPFLMNWQMEALLNETLAKPEVRAPMESSAQALQAVNRVAAVAEQLPQTIAAERAAIFNEVAKREPVVSKLLLQTKETAAQAQALTQSGERLALTLNETTKGLNTTIASVDALMAKQSKGPSSEPFRIEPYAQAVSDLHQTVMGVNTLLANTEKFVDAKPWQAALVDADNLAKARIDQVFWRAVMLLGFFFALLLVYRVLTARLVPRKVAA
jgi:hypothetical protein